jgi:WD domain, G-beta repeat
MARLLSLLVLALPAVVSAAPPAITAIAYHSEGKSLAVGLPGEVRLLDPDKPELVSKAPIVTGQITALAFAPGGRWLAVAHGEIGKTGEVQLFRMSRAGRAEATEPVAIAGHKDSIYALAFSPDGKTLATAGYDRLIHLWDIPENGKVVATPRLTLKDHSDTIYALSWNHDGTLLASGSADRSIKVWDAATGKRLYTLGDSTDWVYCLAWSPDKKHLAAGGVDKSLRVWEVDKDGGKLLLSAFAHTKPVWRLAYTADGHTLYTAGEDRIIKAWDAAKLTESKVFDAQPDTILDLALRPDGKQLAVARFDGALVFLDPITGKSSTPPLGERPVSRPSVAPAPPKPQKLAPNGGERGKSVRVVVTGANLDQVTRVTTSTDTVTAKIDPATRTAARLELEVTTTSATPIGAVQLTFEGEGGKSAPITFVIDRFPAIAETGITDSARVAQAVKLPVTIVGTIDRAGDADFFRFDAAIGDQIGLHVTTTELGSKLDPSLVITDAGGTILAEGTGTLGFRVPKAGAYAVGIRDREYRGGSDFTYRLHIGDVPVITGIFPLAAQRGRTTDVHVEGVNLGSPSGFQVKITVPADAAPGSRVPVPLPTGPNRPIGAAELVVAEFPSMVIDPVAGADIRVPGSADGILTKPHEAQNIRFNARKGERLVVEALARRAGSPVDSVIEVLDGSGKPVPRAVLRSTAKTYVTFRDHDSSSSGIRLETWNELAIDDYLFVDGELTRIIDLPKGPDDDCQFYSVGGQRVGYLGTTPAHHAQGSPMYKVEIQPPGKAFPPNGLPVFPIHYRNDDGGPGYGKDSFLMFEPPTDGTYQVRVTDARGAGSPTHSFRVTVRPPKPDFSVSFNPTAPAVWKGGAIPITVTVTRLDGFDGEVRVQLDGLPAGFAAPPTFVEAGHNSAAFALFADADATVPPKTQLKLIARATIGGKEVVREAVGGMPSVVAVGDLITKTRVTEIAIKPGQETRFVVDIERQGKFAGRVPVEVRGLPHGVRVLNIGLNGILITERETSREVVLYAEPWVKPMEHPIVVLSRSEARNTDHAAKSVLLKVEK